MHVAIIVLAAGGGRRFGRTSKLLAVLHDRPVVSWALDAAIASALRPVVLVVGHQARAVADLAPQGVHAVRARRWRHGIAHSLGAGLEALDGWKQVGAVCVGLGDQPRVGPGAYARLAAAYDDGAQLGVATYSGVRGNPVLIARSLWAEARALDGDEGARVLMRSHPVVEVDCDGTGDPRDVDTPADLAELEGHGG